MPNRILFPLIVACALFMENLDSTVLSTALPAIAEDLAESPIRLKLALTSYLLAIAVSLPASGWLADRFGSRLVFRLAIILFCLGSVMCAFSDSIGWLVVGRIVQGIGGSLMVPVGRLIVLRAVPKSELVGSMAWLTIPALLGPVTGPLLGGFLTTYFDWRWIFWINIPIGVLGIVLASLYLPDIKDEKAARSFDAVGFILAGIGLAFFVTGSTTLGIGVIPLPAGLLFTTVGTGLLVLYVFYSQRRAHPLLDLGLMALPTFRLSLLGGFLFRVGYGAGPFLLPLLLQIGFGFTPLESGGLTFLSAIGAIILKIGSVQILRRYGFRTVLIVNSLFAALFIALPGLFTPSTPIALMAGVLLMSGFFRSLQFTGLNALSVADVPHERMSDATTLSSVAQQVSLSLGISVGAMTLEMMTVGGVIDASDFLVPFLIVGAIGASSALAFWALPADAGQEVSGHRRQLPDPVAAARERG